MQEEKEERRKEFNSHRVVLVPTWPKLVSLTCKARKSRYHLKIIILESVHTHYRSKFVHSKTAKNISQYSFRCWSVITVWKCFLCHPCDTVDWMKSDGQSYPASYNDFEGA